MKAETLLFLKRSFPVSFGVARVAKTKEENEDLAFVTEPIPPPHPQKPDFGTRKLKITIMTQHVVRNKYHTLWNFLDSTESVEICSFFVKTKISL